MIKKTLPNGLTVVLKEDRRCPLLTIQAWVSAGSLDEGEDEKGMAHLLEHMLFKGTTKRAVGEIARTIEACGGGINAYTTFDRTVYYLTVSKDHADTGSEVLADAIFNSSFDLNELEKEKEVVVEEIRRSLDNPAAQVGRRIFSHCFAGCEAARPIIGSEESVRGFTRDKVVGFHRRWYQPNNITVVAVGNFDEAVFLETLSRDFGCEAISPKPVRSNVHYEFPQNGAVEMIRADYKQPRLEIVLPAAALENSDSVYLDLAAFALGNGDASRLTRQLRDNLQYVSAIGSSVYSPAFGGIFSISVYPLLEHYEDCLEKIGEVFGEFKYGAGVTDKELARARSNLKADYCYQQETIDGLAKSIGYGLTTKYEEFYEDVYMGMVDKADPVSIRGAVDRWLVEQQAVIIGMVSEDASVNENVLKERFLSGVERAKRAAKRPGALVELRNEPEVIDLLGGVQLVYRHVPDAKFMSLIAVTEGGLRAESANNAGFHHVVGQLWGRKSKTYSYEEILDRIDGMGATIDGFSGKDSFGLRLHCLAEQWNDVLPYFISTFKEPAIPDELWQTTINEINEQIKSEDDTPSSIAFRRFQEIVFSDHPYRFPIYGTSTSIAAMNQESTINRLLEERDAGPWVVAAAGPLPKERIVNDLHEYLGWWRTKESARKLLDGSLLPLPKATTDRIEKKREQTHIIAGFRGLNWEDEDRAACDVLSLILGGQGGRLFYELRDQQSLAYVVTAISNHGRDPGIFAGYIATAPEKAERATDTLISQLFTLAETEPSEIEVERAINVLIGNHGEDMQRANSQALTMALMQLYGIGAADFLDYPNRLKQVTPEAVKKVARRIFDRDHLVIVQVG